MHFKCLVFVAHIALCKQHFGRWSNQKEKKEREKKSTATAMPALNLKVNCKNIALVIGLLSSVQHRKKNMVNWYRYSLSRWANNLCCYSCCMCLKETKWDKKNMMFQIHVHLNIEMFREHRFSFTPENILFMRFSMQKDSWLFLRSDFSCINLWSSSKRTFSRNSILFSLLLSTFYGIGCASGSSFSCKSCSHTANK